MKGSKFYTNISSTKEYNIWVKSQLLCPYCPPHRGCNRTKHIDYKRQKIKKKGGETIRRWNFNII